MNEHEVIRRDRRHDSADGRERGLIYRTDMECRTCGARPSFYPGSDIAELGRATSWQAAHSGWDYV